MREVNAERASTFDGDVFYFPDIYVLIHHNNNTGYMVDAWHPVLIKQMDPRGELIFTPHVIATMSFPEREEAIDVTTYILCKIALAEALMGWMVTNE